VLPPYPSASFSGIRGEYISQEECLMSLKTVGLVVAILGGLFALFSATGHMIGVLNPGFGPNQLLGTIAGVVVLIVGVVLYIVGSRRESPASE
jgi:hypothetical protein